MNDRTVLTVSHLLESVNAELSSRYRDVFVEGEVTNFMRAGSGHCYFSIKDSHAQLRVVMFAMYSKMLKFRIENGLKIIVRGRLTIYEARGEFQLNAITAEPAGIGALQLAFEQLKARLQAEGLFEESRKKPLPMLPQRIAIVTSPTGAAIRDILHVLGRRFEGLSIQIYPVRVQGTSAAREIAAAIRNLSRWQMHDVVLICRGGGSLEDLWPFNEEVVARAIAACTIPTISGVGHEVDFTIADFVSDHRAPTPSAAAEIVIRAKSEICSQIDNSVRRVRGIIERRVSTYRSELRHLTSSDRLGAFPTEMRRRRERLQRNRVSLYRLLGRQAQVLRQRLARANEPLSRFPARLGIRERRRYMAALEERLGNSMKVRADRGRRHLRSIVATLQAVSPLSVLMRGYAIAFANRGGRLKPILDAANVAIGEAIEVQLKRGRLNATVDAKSLGIESVMPMTEELKIEN